MSSQHPVVAAAIKRKIMADKSGTATPAAASAAPAQASAMRAKSDVDAAGEDTSARGLLQKRKPSLLATYR